MLEQAAQNNNGMKEGKTPKKWTARRIVAAVVITVLILAGCGTAYFFSSDLPARVFTAVTVGTHDLTAAQYSYYFSSAYNNFVLENEDLLSAYGLDTSTPLAEQTITSGTTTITWEEYFHNLAMSEIINNYATYDAAVAAGVSLTEEDTASIDLYMQQIEQNAQTNNIRLASYLYIQYGKGVTLDIIRHETELTRLALRYQQVMTDSYEITDAELETAYQALKDSLDLVTYYSYYFEIENAGDMTESAEEEKALAQEMYDNIIDGESFAALAYANALEDEKENYADKDAARYEEYADAITVSAAADWLKDEARVIGDKTIIDGLDGFYVLYFEGRVRPETKTVNVRRILVTPGTEVSSDGLTEAQQEEVQGKAEEILAEYKAGEQTEDAFARLATQYTADTETMYTRGLYEDIYYLSQSEALNDWFFDESRQPGDTGIVISGSGAHVLYYIADGDPFWLIQAETYQKSYKINAHLQALYEDYYYTVHDFGMGYFVSI